MDKKYSNVPNLRFPEFSQEWKFCKLKSLTKIYDGTHQTPDYKDSGIKFVSVEDIKNLSDSTKFITPEAYFKEFKNKPEFGDILMTRIGDIGTPAIVNINEPLAYYVSLALIKPTGINNAFLKYCIESNSFQHELWRKTIHVAFPKKINKEEIGECSLWTTTEKEQEKIASLLSNIDERINTQNKIIEEIISLKNSIIQQIFSNRGLIPNTNKVSLNKILVPGSKTPVDTSQYKKITIKLNYGGIEFSNLEREMKDTRPFYVRKTGELIIGKQNYFNGSIAILDEKYDGTICSNAIMSFIFDKEVDPVFVFTAVSNRQFLKAKSFYANGTGQKELSEKDFLNFEIGLPNINIQKKIGKLIENLDKKLKVEKINLELLMQQKQYLLANLFI